MTLPTRDTRVTYPDGAVEARARVLHIAGAGEGRIAVVTDVTSFHPVDAAWPDQPADTGVIRSAGTAFPVLDAVVGASDGTELFLGADIPVRKGTEGWAFVVAHVLDEGAAVAEGDEVDIEADVAARRSLSIGHTACHVASLALNRALAGRWSKSARTDALGNPDFDGTAIDTSRIHPNGSVDRYRLNKSLRRAGFDATGLDAAIGELAPSVERTLAEWAESGAAVHVEREGSGEGLTDRRSWVCELPGGTARIPCGGTHARSLAELGDLHVTFELSDDDGTPVLEMRTNAQADR